MRPTLPRPIRRRPADPGASRLAKGGRGVQVPAGGSVAPTAEYVGRRGRRGAGSVRGGSTTRFPRRRSAAVVRRSVLAALIVASFALITVTYRGGVVLHGAQLAVLDVVAPIERGMSRAWDPIAGAWNWSNRIVHAANENPELRAENAELREAVRVARQQEDELLRLRRAFNYDQTANFPEGFDRVYASVLVRVPGSVESTLTISRGSDDGIQVDDAVMVTGGLLGRVVAVKAGTSVVALLTDEGQNVSALVVGSEAFGLLRTTSTEGSPVMRLEYVQQKTKVSRNDLVVTSGFRSGELGSVYPANLPIGIVESVGNDPADTHATVQVRPLADFDRIDELFVLVPSDRGGAA